MADRGTLAWATIPVYYVASHPVHAENLKINQFYICQVRRMKFYWRKMGMSGKLHAVEV